MAWKTSKCAMSAASPTVRVPPCVGSAAASGVPRMPRSPGHHTQDDAHPDEGRCPCLTLSAVHGLAPFVPLPAQGALRRTSCEDGKGCMGSTLMGAPHKGGAWHMLAQMGTAHRPNP